MELIFLGTGSQKPSKTRNVSSIALRFKSNNEYFLIDCGEGTQRQILYSDNLRLPKIHSIFITHMHGDHIFGLPGLLSTLKESMYEKERVIMIYGPNGILKYLKQPYNNVDFDFVSVKEFNNKEDYISEIKVSKDLIFEVIIKEVLHEIKTYGFVFNQKIKDYNFKEEAREVILKIIEEREEETKEIIISEGGKGKNVREIFKILKNKRVEYKDGTVIDIKDPKYGFKKKEKKICILLDNYDASNIIESAKDCNILVTEATCGKTSMDKESYEEIKRRTIEKGHSTPEMAGELASKINARKLVLTHFSARYIDDEKEENKKIIEELKGCAKEKYLKEIIMAKDLMNIEIY
jgi:ribonuclease Z